MFKKAVEAKSLQRLSGADKKKLKRTIKQRFRNVSDADLDVLLPPKAEITITKFQNRVHVYAVEAGFPMIFDIDGRGTHIFPTAIVPRETEVFDDGSEIVDIDFAHREFEIAFKLSTMAEKPQPVRDFTHREFEIAFKLSTMAEKPLNLFESYTVRCAVYQQNTSNSDPILGNASLGVTKEVDKVADRLQSTGISSGGSGAKPSGSAGVTKEEVKRLPVKGLELFGVKLSDASKKLGKKFATGASVVKGPTEKEQIDVQGDIAYDVVEFITDTWHDVPFGGVAEEREREMRVAGFFYLFIFFF